MSIFISGQPTRCCRKTSRRANKRFLTWTVGRFDPGGNVTIVPGGLQLSAVPDGFLDIYDLNTNIDPSRNLCFEGTVQPVSWNMTPFEGNIEFGLSTIMFHFDQYFLIEELGGSPNTWAVTWSKDGGTTFTTYNLNVPFDTTVHKFTVCKRGTQITVKVDNLPLQTFSADANFPNMLLNPVADVVNGAVMNVYTQNVYYV